MKARSPRGTTPHGRQSAGANRKWRLLAHRGICISDLDAACELDAKTVRFPVENGVADERVLQALTGHSDAAVRSQRVQEEAGMSLSIWSSFCPPPAVGTRHRRPLNQCGLTHLCFWTPCIEDTARLIRSTEGLRIGTPS